MLTFLLWLVLLVFVWPVALLALILYPVVWVIGLPLRLIGLSTRAILDLIRAILGIPARLVRGPRALRSR